ncbi:MAG: metal-dependent hydrolase [Methanobacteriales archaeon HGW-Methanobacteriales-1]|jgi:hypothetical protein|nr:MAG: metal-dependent hydrolase [Methanobacteriales archaeon HGW-Methanobacteriales-1]
MIQMSENIFIEDIEIEYSIIRRKIKNPRMEFKTGRLVLILPNNYKNHKKLIEKHKNWIYNKLDVVEKSKNCYLNINRSKNELRAEIHHLVEFYSSSMQLTPGNISFRQMKKRWGSCDSEGNLKFNTRLRYLPEDLIDYVVFHELAHLLEFAHNRDFWQIIRLKFPDYKKKDQELSIYWFAIMEKTNNFQDP